MREVGVLILLVAAAFPSGNASSGAFPLLQSLTANPSKVPWEGLAIVVNRKNSATNVTLPQLRAMFFGERKFWTCRRRINLTAMRRGTAERQTVLRMIYKMDDTDLDRYFFYQVYKGEDSSSPTTLQTPADVKKFVVSTPGALGYIRASDVDDSVKVVRVNGLLPEDDGYPLRLRVRQPK